MAVRPAPAAARAAARVGGSPALQPGRSQSEGPPWKKRADDDAKVKKAGWGGVARKGAGRMRDAGPGDASKAFRAATPEGREAVGARGLDRRGRRARRGRQGRGPRPVGTPPGDPVDEDELTPDPSLRRAVAAKAADRLDAKLKDAGKAFRRERFEEARSLLRPLAEQAPTAESVRELLGLTYYRLGRWKLAVTELEAFRDLSGSTEQHPVLADCYRALGRHAKVAELWEELRAASPGAALVAEGRIVYAGSLADQGRLEDAIAVLSASKPPDEATRRSTTCGSPTRWPTCTSGRATCRRRVSSSASSPAADPELGDVDARLRAPARERARRRPGAVTPPGRTRRRSFPLHVRSPHRRRHPCPRTVVPAPGTNLSVLVGTLSRPAELRTLPSGDEVLALEVTVRPEGRPAESVPVAWIGAPAAAAPLGRRRGDPRRRPGPAAVLPGRRGHAEPHRGRGHASPSPPAGPWRPARPCRRRWR